jgi:hypothetical protein
LRRPSCAGWQARTPTPGVTPFHLYLHHADLSAELVLAAGGSQRTAAFIRGTAAGDDARLQRALTEADDAS